MSLTAEELRIELTLLSRTVVDGHSGAKVRVAVRSVVVRSIVRLVGWAIVVAAHHGLAAVRKRGRDVDIGVDARQIPRKTLAAVLRTKVCIAKFCVQNAVYKT